LVGGRENWAGKRAEDFCAAAKNVNREMEHITALQLTKEMSMVSGITEQHE